jgi:type I restriction enzyme S subunit
MLEKKLVPKLRFAEFDGVWNSSRLGNLGEFKGGGTPTTDNSEYWDGDIPWISSSDVKENDILNLNVTRYLSKKAIEESATKIIPEGSILFVSRVGVGKLTVSEVKLCTSQDFANLSPKKDNSYYIAYYFLSKNKLLHQYAQGTSIKGFTMGDLKSIPINFPSLPEQQKIASFLTEVDTKLSQLTKKKALLENYKKGVMQQIFSQEIRFKDDDGNDYGDWEEKKLGTICNYKNGGSFESYVSDEGSYNLISLNSLDISGKLKAVHKRVTIDDNSLNKGDLVMVLSDVAHGYFLGLTDIIPNDTFVLNQRMGALKPKIDINRYYLKTYINFSQKYFKLMGQGSSQQNLSKGDILNFNVKLPSIEEQTKIANFLSELDTKIEVLSTSIENTQTFKKGLLQQLFV